MFRRTHTSNAISCCKYAGSVNGTLKNSMLFKGLGQNIAFRCRVAMVNAPNISFYNGFKQSLLISMANADFCSGGGCQRCQHGVGQHRAGTAWAGTGLGRYGPVRPRACHRSFYPFRDIIPTTLFGNAPCRPPTVVESIMGDGEAANIAKA